MRVTVLEINDVVQLDSCIPGVLCPGNAVKWSVYLALQATNNGPVRVLVETDPPESVTARLVQQAVGKVSQPDSPGHKLFCEIIERMKSFYRCNGKEVVGIALTEDQTVTLRQYGRAERGIQSEWLRFMDLDTLWNAPEFRLW